MKQIPLTRGQIALVDDDDYEELSKYKWHANKGKCTWYAYRQYRHSVIKNKKGHSKQVLVSMHRQIIKPPENKNIDHRDGNGINNQKHNLRICCHAENTRNQRRRGVGYKGVYRTANNKRWLVVISVNGMIHRLGSFTCEKAAAKEYDKLAKLLHGEFACLNFP